MRGSKVLYSHKDDEHVTDPVIVDRLETTFKVAFDPCPADHYIHRQFEKINNERLKEPVERQWMSWPKAHTFINPPYSDIDLWTDLAIKQFQMYPDRSIIMLLPARTDRPWFEKLFNHAHAIGFIRGRLKFLLVDPEKKGILMKSKWQAPFPSMIVVLEQNVSISRNNDIIKCLDDLNCVSLILKEVNNNHIINR